MICSRCNLETGAAYNSHITDAQCRADLMDALSLERKRYELMEAALDRIVGSARSHLLTRSALPVDLLDEVFSEYLEWKGRPGGTAARQG